MRKNELITLPQLPSRLKEVWLRFAYFILIKNVKRNPD